MSSVSLNLINVPHSYSIEGKRRYSGKTDSTHIRLSKKEHGYLRYFI